MDSERIPINLTAVRLKQLELLQVVAESGSISAAARYLNTSNSAANEMLRCLERAFAARLFVSGPQGIVLTTEGQRVARSARVILRELTLAMDETGGGLGQKEELRVGIAPLVLLTELPDALMRLRALHPALHVHLRQTDAAEAMAALRDGEIDIAVTANNPSLLASDEREALSIRTIAEDLWILYVSSCLEFPPGWRATPSNIRALPWLFPVRQSPTRRGIEDWFLAKGLTPPEPRMEIMGVDAANELMKRLPCATLLPSKLGRSGNFPHLLPIADCDMSFPLNIAITARKTMLRRPFVKSFAQEVTARFAEAP